MIGRISPRDLESLSAYLDGQLTAREHARLEARLEEDQNLQVSLEELRRTRAALRSLPIIRAPRNFTLTPEMVGVRKTLPRFYPTLRLSSVLAMLLLALVLLGDFLGPWGTTPLPVMKAPMAQTQVVASEAEVEMQPDLRVGEGIAVEEVSEEESDEAVEKAMPAAEMATELIMPTGEGAYTSTLDQDAEEPRVPVTPTPAPTSTLIAPAEFAAPYPEPVVPVETGITSTQGLATVRETERMPSIRVVEIALALVALVTGLAAILARRGASG